MPHDLPCDLDSMAYIEDLMLANEYVHRYEKKGQTSRLNLNQMLANSYSLSALSCLFTGSEKDYGMEEGQ